MEVQIRRLVVADLDQIMEIEPVAFGSHHWSRESFINEINNSGGIYYTLIEPSTDTVLGYSGFWLIDDEAHITTLAVHPDYRREGLGELLLINDIQAALKVNATRMTLEVRVSNDAAQKLYYKYGFKSLGLRRKYYQDNSEDALVLWTENIKSDEFKNLVDKCISDWKSKRRGIKLDLAIPGLMEIAPKQS